MAAEFENERVEDVWLRALTSRQEIKDLGRMRHLLKRLPAEPRCRTCNAPFSGIGGTLMRIFYRKEPSKLNPYYCNYCEEFARRHPGGAEIELTLLFADVRGSTALAERVGDAEFSRLIDRFYRVASRVLVESDAMIEKLIGDEVAALFLPGWIGPGYTQKAVDAGRQLLGLTGHGGSEEPWLPVGVGVHTGRAFVGSVGVGQGMVELTALGDTVNTAARLASEAGSGEILISEEAVRETELDPESLEKRVLALKGRSSPIAVRVFRA